MDHDHSVANDSGSNCMHSMQMFFYTSCESTILFETWKTKTCLQMFGSCVVICLAAIFYEGLKGLRNYLQDQATCRPCKKQIRNARGCCTGTNETQAEDVQILQPSFGPFNMSRKQVLLLLHVIQSFLYLVQVGFGYLVMLVAMTFNVWLFISIFIGSGIGYFIFNFRKVWNTIQGRDECPSEESETHCHL